MPAADTADLMRLDKRDLAEGWQRLAARARRYKEAIKDRAETTMHIALAGGGAFAVGYYMGTVKRDNAAAIAGGDMSSLQTLGIDTDLLIGGGLAVAGLTGMMGKKMSAAAVDLGTGALAFYLGSLGEKKGLEPPEA